MIDIICYHKINEDHEVKGFLDYKMSSEIEEVINGTDALKRLIMEDSLRSVVWNKLYKRNIFTFTFFYTIISCS